MKPGSDAQGGEAAYEAQIKIINKRRCQARDIKAFRGKCISGGESVGLKS